MPDSEGPRRSRPLLRAGQGIGPAPKARRQRGRQAGVAAPAARPAAGGRQPPDVLRAFFRPSRAQFLIGAILLLFAAGAVMQYRTRAADLSYSTASRADLVSILDNVNAESKRLEAEISDLERTRGQLRSGADSARVAQEEAKRRLETAQIMAGTVGAQGKGVTITIADPNQAVTASMLLDAIEELRDAGAEVIAINGKVRVVASTWFGSGPNGLIVDGVAIERPIQIDAIGDPQALEGAARFRGGLVSQVENQTVGGSVNITRPALVVVTALHAVGPNQFAKPA